MTLEGLYNLKLLDYKINGHRDKLAKLLALLILPEKDKYEPLKVSEGEFYKRYKKEIDQKIAKVEKDFEITPTDIVKYIEEERGIICDNYNHQKIWLVYFEGFGSMHWGIWYQPEMSPEEIYEECFKEQETVNYQETGLRYQKLIEACREYVEAAENKTLLKIKTKMKEGE